MENRGSRKHKDVKPGYILGSDAALHRMRVELVTSGAFCALALVAEATIVLFGDRLPDLWTDGLFWAGIASIGLGFVVGAVYKWEMAAWGKILKGTGRLTHETGGDKSQKLPKKRRGI